MIIEPKEKTTQKMEFEDPIPANKTNELIWKKKITRNRKYSTVKRLMKKLKSLPKVQFLSMNEVSGIIENAKMGSQKYTKEELTLVGLLD